MFMTGDIKKAALAALLIMASPEIMMPVGYSGQDEMTYICFFTISIKEKNIFKLISYVIGLIAPLFLFELFYRNDMTYQAAKTANDFTQMAWLAVITWKCMILRNVGKKFCIRLQSLLRR